VNPSEIQVARSRLYGLLATLVTHGPTKSALAVARDLPALEALGANDPETLAAGHHAALSLGSASAFLSPDGLAGGPAPDDLGSIFAALSELDAHGVDLPSVVALLDRTLSWLPQFVLCVRSSGEPAWTAVVELSLELCAAHRSTIDLPRIPVGPTAPPIDLEDAATSLRSIGAALCRPAVSAWMPSGAAIGALAEVVDLPGGFGDRADRLIGLLYAAADAGRLPALCDGLRAVLSTWASDLRELEVELGIPLRAWHERAESTAAIVGRIGSSAPA
jgi:hypothetical protein